MNECMHAESTMYCILQQLSPVHGKITHQLRIPHDPRAPRALLFSPSRHTLLTPITEEPDHRYHHGHIISHAKCHGPTRQDDKDLEIT